MQQAAQQAQMAAASASAAQQAGSSQDEDEEDDMWSQEGAVQLVRIPSRDSVGAQIPPELSLAETWHVFHRLYTSVKHGKCTFWMDSEENDEGGFEDGDPFRYQYLKMNLDWEAVNEVFD